MQPSNGKPNWAAWLAVLIPAVALFAKIIVEVARTEERVEQLEGVTVELRFEVRRLQDDIKRLLPKVGE
jgi:hypothetical protein